MKTKLSFSRRYPDGSITRHDPAFQKGGALYERANLITIEYFDDNGELVGYIDVVRPVNVTEKTFNGQTIVTVGFADGTTETVVRDFYEGLPDGVQNMLFEGAVALCLQKKGLELSNHGGQRGGNEPLTGFGTNVLNKLMDYAMTRYRYFERKEGEIATQKKAEKEANRLRTERKARKAARRREKRMQDFIAKVKTDPDIAKALAKIIK